MLDIAFDVSVLVINMADIIYQAFNASSENEIQICIKKLKYQIYARPQHAFLFYHLKNR
jgi:hypothetical protein